LEAAFWWPNAIQGRARALKFSTDAAYRFERGVDPSSTAKYLNYLTQLILEICGGQAGPVSDQTLSSPSRAPIELRVARVEKVVGVPITSFQIAEYFDRLGFAYARKQPGTPQEIFLVDPPAYRFDLSIEEDLIEEITRIYGFENIPEIDPKATLIIKPTARKA
jgi:phenylalanyl-tRNA synthetase beta chain